MWPPLFLTTAFNLPSKASHAARSSFWGIKSHSCCNFLFKSFKVLDGVVHALLSKMDHTEKSRGFKSGLLEGHSSLLRNDGMWVRIQLWVIFEPWDGAEFCWKVHGAPSKCRLAQGRSSVWSWGFFGMGYLRESRACKTLGDTLDL